MTTQYTVMQDSSEPRAGERGPEAISPFTGPAGALYAPAPGAQQQQPVFAYTAPKVLYDRFKAHQSLALGVTQICAGVLCVIFNSMAINAYSGVAYVGHGIWGGLLCIIAGILGVCAAKCKTKCKVVAYMVLCIVAAAACLFIAIFGVFGAALAGQSWQDPEYTCQYSYSQGMDRFGRPCPSVAPNRAPVRLWMNVLLVLMAVLEAVVCIWGSALCCKVACCGQSSPIMIPVQYIPMQGTAQFVVMTPPQQGGGPMIVQPAAGSSYQPATCSVAMQGGYEGAVGGQHALAASGEASAPPMYTAQPPQYNEEKVALL